MFTSKVVRVRRQAPPNSNPLIRFTRSLLFWRSRFMFQATLTAADSRLIRLIDPSRSPVLFTITMQISSSLKGSENRSIGLFTTITVACRKRDMEGLEIKPVRRESLALG